MVRTFSWLLTAGRQLLDRADSPEQTDLHHGSSLPAPRSSAPSPHSLSPLLLLACGLLLLTSPLSAEEAKPRNISGIHPNLAMYNNEGECGTGAVVPWAGRLWVITYGPHCVKGSSDRLYEITPDFQQVVRPESVGGTHANRMIHKESKQLFIGYHAIAEDGTVRTIPWKFMPGRLTGTARHLTDPAHKIYSATMEEGLYEIDVKTLEVKELIRDGNISDTKGLELSEKAVHSKLPGYHGKGLFTGQGRLIYANNGERDPRIATDPTIPSGALAEWRGEGDWQMIRRNQFTEVRGPGDIFGNEHPDTDPVWALGWDFRSVILMLLDGGQWHAFRLPKGSHSYDGSHGWNTEWPRTRDIGEADMLGTMHGTFWHFPKTFSLKNSAGIAPRSNYLKVIGDFCRWNDLIVLGCDDSAKSEFINTRPFKSKQGAPGQSNSNLWFVEPARLDQLGPAIGRGSVWLRDDVKTGAPSDPYLFAGYDRRMLHLSHAADQEVTFTIEVDRKGDNTWETLRTLAVPAKGYVCHVFSADEKGAWVRLKAGKDAPQVAAVFQYANADKRPTTNDAVFTSVANPETVKPLGGIVRALGNNRRILGFVGVDLESGAEQGYYELDATLKLTKKDETGSRNEVVAAVAPAQVYEVDAASVIVTEDGKRFRIPMNAAYLKQSAGKAQPKSDPPAEEKPAADTDQPNLALKAKVEVSSTHQNFSAANAVDGEATEKSRWVSADTGEKWIALDLGEEKEIASARVTTGLNRSPDSVVKSMKLQMRTGDAWADIPSAAVDGNRLVVRTINFKEPVRARQIRLVSDDESYVRVYEIALYAKPMADAQSVAEAVAGLGTARVCREVATERDLFNCHGTFYELPARNAQGFFKIRPIATHNLAIHDYASYRGLMLITGLDPSVLKEKNEHIIVSDDGKCALWAGVIDDLWKLGKPRGEGGPWKDTQVQAGVPSDPYLMTGYDKKTLTLSHAGEGAVNVTVEIDPDGTGLWCTYKTFAVEAGKPMTHEFPEGFNAYWVRVKADQACKATAQLKYE